MPARPFPVDFVTTRSAIETFPPRQVSLAAKPTAHRFHYITRVSKQLYVAWFAQRFQSNCSCRDLCLLIRGAAQVFADSAPVAFVAKQSNGRGASRLLSITKTRTIAENCYLLEHCHRYRLPLLGRICVICGIGTGWGEL